jgi:serine/threonine-protein kinase
MQPEKLGPFNICRVLGRGGMGAVYEGVHEQTGESVAIKVLIDTFDDADDTRSRFEAEIDTLKRLRHPNIVRLFGFGRDQGTLYYVMELVKGASLYTELKRRRYFNWFEVAKVGMEMCLALRHAHDRGITHRDVKPANILLEDSGLVKLSDFGIASLFGAQRLTDVNSVVGTLEYMSPEQALAFPVGPRSDLYSLGAVLYSLILNKPPFSAKNLAEVIKKHQENIVEPIRRTRADVPEEMESVILSLLQIQPNARPQSPFTVARRFQAILQSKFGQIEKIVLRPTVDDFWGRGQDQDIAVDSNVGLVVGKNSSGGVLEVELSGNSVADIDVTKSLTSAEPSNRNINSTQFEFQRQNGISLSDAADKNNFDRNKLTEGGVVRVNSVETGRVPAGILSGSGKSKTAPRHGDQNSVFTKVNDHELGELSGLPVSSGYWISFQTLFASLCLILIGGVVYYLLQPVSPDVLYERIITKLNKGGEGDEELTVEALRRAEAEIRYFLNHYADHVRVGQVRTYEDQLSLANLERRLERRRQISDPAAISPVERAYLEATSWIKSDPTKAILKLQAVIDLFGNDIVPTQSDEIEENPKEIDQKSTEIEKNSTKIDQKSNQSLQTNSSRKLQSPTEMCVELARRRLREIERRIESITADQEAFLDKRIEDAKTLLDKEPEQARKLLIGIIELYGDQNWTSKHVNEAHSLLNKIPPSF